jgi:two-component system cell cycle sensor histidine kinase/response regulator CckA
LKDQSVELLLLDMIIKSGINGRETFRQVIEIHSEQKAILVSGYAETNEVLETQRLGAGKFLKKPLTIEKIGPAVTEELNT